jgi:hypothetical protein
MELRFVEPARLFAEWYEPPKAFAQSLMNHFPIAKDPRNKHEETTL